MRIQTKYLGEVDSNEELVINFFSGLPGFTNESKFMLLDLPGNPVFQILQSIITPDIAFVLTNPYHFHQDYAFELDSTVNESLKITNEKDVTVFSIVTLKDPFENSTLNLKAPIIINPTSKLGKQYILNVDNYLTKTSITQVKSSVVRGV
ncbi:flagellar assembly protein FliW [Virgibacillus necropolis]|uniref:Flagellar assembly factor FliW n=1 Tax=Virgibacillus necropolis TaxID=163877 RepID=A0A221MAP1_9BACI|nr:flagellar assembly protein FliW [Virgibacillus necropolis]ASN04728.1 flagellar assembly protein FliW [Virgibacillus necropolis]